MIVSVLVLSLFIVGTICLLHSIELACIVFMVTIAIPLADMLVSLIRVKTPLKIQTPDGSNEPFHPSVLFFEKGWNGFSYWMAFTPYPINKAPYRDRWECPCIVASNDGIHWQYPAEVKFLDDLTQSQIQERDYFSDTHLTYDSDRNVLYCYYRLDEGEEPKKVTIFRRESADGKRWSERTSLIYSEAVDALEPLSQSIVYKDSSFSMWYVAHSVDPNGVYRLHSKDGITWGENKKCIFLNAQVTPWHIDCQYIDGAYYMTIYELSQRITLWKSLDGEYFTFVKVLLTIPVFGNCGLFYNNILYRACMVKDQKEYKVYFACGNKKRNTIGLMTGREISRLKVSSTAKRSDVGLLAYDMLSKYSAVERFVFHKIKKIGKR